MQSLSTALENLLRHLSQEIPATPGIRVIDIPFPLKDAFDALSWLASQQTYPQFYWQQRNGDEEAVVLGAITRFTSLDQAQRFLRQHPEHADLRIWGLNAFDPSQGNLLLPRLEWRRCGGKATLRLTLFSESSLQHDAIQAKEFIATLVSIKPLPGLHLTTTREQHWPDKTGWTQLIELATKTIAEGELDKVVLARATDLHFASPVNAAAMMAASRRLNLNCYHFYMAFDGENAFLGSSPERLWRRRDKALRTEALAGTVANNPDDKQAQQLGEWLMADDKNQRENMLVVEDICQRLQADTQTLDVLPPQVLRLRKVQHLRRCIWTSLNKADDVICLHQLQPTAAVAGLPRDLARQFIARHEPFTREWYAGSAGYLSLQQSEFCVSLRSAKLAAMSCDYMLARALSVVPTPSKSGRKSTTKRQGCVLYYKWNSNESHHYRFISIIYFCSSLYLAAILIPDKLMSVSAFNRRWAAVILEALTRHGVRHICIAPGSRSTPLTLAAAENSAFIHHTHFDERGLGHLALGLAKVSKQPVAVIVTSGTAVANLYPALIEAGLTGEKLILLTADRPPELIDCGANQAIRQPGMFASHPTHSISLPRPTQDIPARWLVSTIDHALGTLHAGGVHINCPFAEPLYGEMDDTGLSWQQRLGDWWQDDKPWLREAPRLESEKQRDWFFWRQKRGVVVAGRMSAEEGKKVALWAQTLGWPLIGDVLSQTGQPLPCADLWLGNAKATSELQQAQIVVQLGSSLTGKRLLQWQASCEPEEYWIVDDIEGRLDPAHHRGRRLIANIADWLELHPAEKRQPWCVEIPRLAEQAMQAVIARRDAFGEAQLAHRICDYLPEQGQLFVGNSLVVRLIDALSQLPAGYPVYSNRGASGIDGLLSTAAGVQRASGKPTLAIVGDLSALYDLNALALLRQVSAPLVLIVVNNNGGQIFSLLPTPQSERERFYLMPQNVHFEHAAAMFELKYHRPQNWQELETAFADAWRTPTTTVIEMVVNDTDGAQTLQQLLAQVSHL